MVLYNIIYIIPLIIIVTLFTSTLGAKKLQQEQGRTLKLMSGEKIFGLGIILLVNFVWLHNAVVGIAVLAISILGSTLINRIDRRLRHPQ